MSQSSRSRDPAHTNTSEVESVAGEVGGDEILIVRADVDGGFGVEAGALCVRVKRGKIRVLRRRGCRVYELMLLLELLPPPFFLSWGCCSPCVVVVSDFHLLLRWT